VEINKDLINNPKIKNIALLSFFGVGDFILAIPTINKIRKIFPDSCITLFIREGLNELLNPDFGIEYIVTYKYNNSRQKIIAILFVLYHLIKRKFDLFINLQTPVYNTVGSNTLSFWRNNLLALLSFSKHRLGFDYKKSGILLTNRIYASEEEIQNIHVSDLTFKIINAIENKDTSKSFLRLKVGDADQISAANFLKLNGYTNNKKLVAIVPGSPQSSKLWIGDKFAEMIKILIKRYDVQLMFLGSSNDLEISNDILQKTNYNMFNFFDKTSLGQLMALLEKSDLLICIDSGPMHIAAAVGTPIVALFSGQNLIKNWSPLSNDYKIISKKVKCSPCFKSDCQDNICMKAIDVEEVIDAAEKYIT